ncbi:3-oxoacyl-ACP reductase FabG [Brenneria rubrifaciens]|uniref:SDR family oxidoreductase n=1 Tax=Brenneria rubrifaciens TaxID=55213 RepID=A0A4P8QPL9_9GAMM|nr:3-oxoacyl-ACP reductase FabG [Brenneria rubrifaciens]QCR08376.1 SDR family oxidoreductase [Brenneria rubrifaciens]
MKGLTAFIEKQEISGIRWVFVSGGSRGIGKCIVKMLAGSGLHVVFTYRKNGQAAQEIVNELQQAGLSSEAYCCDVSDREQVNSLANLLLSRLKSPYAVINNAGIVRDSLLVNMSHDNWLDVINGNLNAIYFVNKAFLPEMIVEGNGCIVNISSISAFKGNTGQSNYAASKAAMIGVTRALAVELGRFNIRVNAIAPGLIDTDMVADMSLSEKKSILKKIPLPRMGTPEDVALAVLFLLGEGGRYITGHTLVIDGGMSV